MSYAFPPPALPAVPIAGSDALFPVRRVYCVGRNYADHAAEMGADTREPPFFFSKPADAIVPGGGKVRYPPATRDLQHEVELVVALAGGGSDIAPARALELVHGYAVGIDLTRRDLQKRAKDKGHPWDMSKGFDESAPLGAIQPATRVGHPASGAIWLAVNGQVRQQGDLAQMSWKIAEIIANLSTYVRLAAGDLIFTGTPAGVSTVLRGDVLTAGVTGIGELAVELVGADE
ncbi:MAG TPA: fumarylacetoacetate hydrolase family protein [Accumulibacter sp.]|uniref:fumarylacetoacetate hydrolase family protein n=1 Tax=Accumulibacter sp. TaxID=2053492 RepID=UPI0028793CDC|nr:fumarylacetoacetate hydrolase family protein [Accumulibacter sp.]MDS4012810.1 fumarylacetoacetate hydrolase family protein [Accumulibacter sp.]MDS4055594.1 fumarylacetoacetate hydrolase family protein [Accumulibacter sp.]HMV05862.1 fumarylacetoacetate hydrolase family protein [Accumulibacter sp.]HMW63165.1 fumarylacetoacetate hydrolase family protein [Accumulibacter sp.]HMW79650.1 fumarylacetoacetate hydrolase family protein [Accumulibacter sp.]